MAKLGAYFQTTDIELDQNTIKLDECHDKGYARRELYPWNTHEPDRFSVESLAFLNAQMGKVAPKLEVRSTYLPVLVDTQIGDLR